MKNKSGYIINYQALKLGHTFYNYDVNDDFMHDYNPDFIAFKDLSMHISIDLLKEETSAQLFINLTGSYYVECDRCLHDLKIDVAQDDYLIFREGNGEDDETITYISPNTNFINLQPFIYDFIALSIPMRHVHDDEANCDQEMIKKLKEYLIEE
ncbi:MAG TPA: DUF177 domain-containing protein [Bacteroidales bacterium]|jgi:uncharacterized metal-binding protein YceD (DUF177 family)|nr:DUF177 domain-containing protein [Bacteroidales bacterium]HOB27286.1 DUF177 domain-containing protein [Bacteroidales bacterium]HPZ36228.1 DUF177 domain-containing protein [Bacteroidales bacterium]HQD34643.1 DUF177 domain-containing protein [Bacteroidales bacterium]